MALVSKSIPNLINGVSQQPPALRLPTQGEAQENGLSDVVDGLKKRPPTKFLNKLVKVSSSWTAGSALTSSNTETLNVADCYITTYKRSQTEQYTVVIEPHSTTPVIYVYDINGNLNYQSGKASWKGDGTWVSNNTDSTAYLADVTKEEMTSTSVADATFIVNKSKVVAKSAVKSPTETGNKALVYLKSVNYSRNYTLKINSKNASGIKIEGAAASSAGNANNSSDQTQLKVSTIVSGLRTALQNDTAYVSVNSGSATTHSFPTSHAVPSGHLFGRPINSPWNSGSLFFNMAAGQFNVNPNATYDNNPDNILVIVGGNVIPYAGATQQATFDALPATTIYGDTRFLNGWVYNDNFPTASNSAGVRDNILLPYSALTQTAGYDGISVDMYRGSTVVYSGAAVAANLVISPPAQAELPYFVLTCPDAGNIGDFDITATDDDGGTNLRVFKDTAKSFTDLPNQCESGYRIQVAGDNNKKEDNFYVVYDGQGGSGTWKESVAANLFNEFDLATMPHTLKQQVDGNNNLYFSFTQGQDGSIDTDGNADPQSWRGRKCGDESTNPFPSFVGNTINDIFFHRNRLGIISGENVIFSETSSFFNFFRTTVRGLLDSDPIDVAVSQNEVSELKAALPIQDSLLLFSELNQFTLSASQLLTPAEVTIDQSTKFECDLRTPPVGAGNSVFFNTVGGNFAGVREYYTDGETEIKDATLVTSHVPEYLSGNIRSMAASTNEDMLICLTSSVKSEAYIYKWYNSNNERLQSSWSKWTFNKNVADIIFNNSDLYITFEDGSYEKMNLRTATQDITFSNEGIAEVITGLSGYGANTSINSLAMVDGTLCTISVNTASNKVEFLTTLDGLDKLVVNGKDLLVTDATLVLGTAGYGWKTYTWNNVTSLAGNSAFFTDLASPASVLIYAHFTKGILFKAKAHDVLLDHRVKVQASTSAAAAYTSTNFDDAATLYGWGNNTQFVTYKGEILGTGATQTKDKVIAAINGQSHIENNATVGSYVYAGEPYTFKYQLSEQVFEPSQGDSTKIARFQLRNMSFNFNDTGTFNVAVDSTGRNTVNHKFTGRLLGQADNLLGYSAVITDDSFKVGVQSQANETAITITNDTHLPCVFQSAEYEAWVTLRNRRL